MRATIGGIPNAPRHAEGRRQETALWLSTVVWTVTLALTILAVPLAAAAQLPGKVPRIGVLRGGGQSPPSCSHSDFLRRLHELGYVEGQNLLIEWRCAELNDERARQFAGELVQLGVDVIVADNRLAALSTKAATTTIPIVFIAGDDPVPELVSSLARPGGNVTGVSNLTGWDFFAKHLELLQTAVPGVTCVALLLSAGDTYNAVRMTSVEKAARAVGVHLHPVEVAVPDGLEAAFSAMTRQGVGGLLVGFDTQLQRHRAQIAELAAKSRLPTIAEWRAFAEQGGLMSYGVERADMVRRAATQVDKILKGAKPIDLPVEQPTTFNLVINLKTAQALGITIPPHLLVVANEVIK
jgi:putative ABC transport system substrate-binding protein